MLKEAGTQTLGAYIDKWQTTVTEWVPLRLILEICNRETGYKGGGRRRELWWYKMAAWKLLSATLDEMLEEARAWSCESGRRGGGGRGREVAESDAGRDGPRYSGMDTGEARIGE